MFHQIATARDRVQAALRLRFDRHTRADVAAWVAAEIGPWASRLRERGLAGVTEDVLALNRQHPWVQAYRVDGAQVTAIAKPASLMAGLSPDDAASAATRARLYGTFLAAVAAPGPVHLAINLNDVPHGPAAVPVFGFQKDRGSDAILLPDIDLLNDKYVRPSWLSLDLRPFRRKTNTAIFVGSTTGGLIDAAAASSLSLPRLRAAVAFKGHPRIHFLLANVVQCTDAATQAAVRAAVGVHAPQSWKQQFRHRFILSMDGNGATCARVVVALKSNSVLLKYDSDRLLYYFHGLRAGTHYLPIQDDTAIDPVLADAQAHPDRYAAIAKAGSRFYARTLTQPMVRHYMRSLLAAYRHALSGHSHVPDELRSPDGA